MSLERKLAYINEDEKAVTLSYRYIERISFSFTVFSKYTFIVLSAAILLGQYKLSKGSKGGKHVFFVYSLFYLLRELLKSVAN